jgi:histidine triad (HIT) family protein
MISQKCLFCNIVEKKEEKNFFLENNGSVALLDLNPISDGHTLIVTKKHYRDISELGEEDGKDVMNLIRQVIARMKRNLLVKEFNILSNIGRKAYQEIFHAHVHIIPKYNSEEGFIFGSKKVISKNIEEVEKIIKKDK